MHVKALSALLEAPRYAFEGLPKESSDLSLCFIIDRVRQPEAMSRLYRVGEPVDIFVNDRLIARGEVVLIDGALGVTLTEIVRTER